MSYSKLKSTKKEANDYKKVGYLSVQAAFMLGGRKYGLNFLQRVNLSYPL